MLELMRYIVDISSYRDRTQINAALIKALRALLAPESVTLYRAYAAKEKMIFACAGIENNEVFSHNAYVPKLRYCKPAADDSLIAECWASQKVKIVGGATHIERLLVPVIQNREVYYLMDIRPTTGADSLELYKAMIQFFSNFTGLLDYGETDTLTTLPSRKTFEKHMFEWLETDSQKNQGDSESHFLAICDIDDFKNVNNAFGHMIGDELLIMLARSLRQFLPFTDQVFRYGGEEFVILLQPTNLESAQSLFDNLREHIAAQTFSRVGQITVSIGFTKISGADTPDAAIERADEAVYYAKQHGRNQATSYETLIDNAELHPKEVLSGEIELF